MTKIKSQSRMLSTLVSATGCGLGVTFNQLLYLEISCRGISFSSVSAGTLKAPVRETRNSSAMTFLFLISVSLSFAGCRRHFQERNQPLGIEWLFDAPEDVIDAQVFFTKLDYFGNGYLFPGAWVHVLVVAILDRKVGRERRAFYQNRSSRPSNPGQYQQPGIEASLRELHRRKNSHANE